MPAAQIARIEQFFVEIWNGGNLALIDDLFAPDFLGRVFPDLAGPSTGRARLTHCLTAVRTAVPDWHISILHQVGLDTVVITHWQGDGIHRGGLFGHLAQGQPLRVTGMSISRLAAGQIAEHWDHWSRRALLRQLAAAPGRASGGERQAGEPAD